MRNQALSLIILLAAAAGLAGCGNDSIAFTYKGEESAWKEARQAGKDAFAKKDFSTAEGKYLVAVEHARHLQSTNPHHLVETLLDLADTYKEEGKIPQAKQTYQDVLAASKQIDTEKNASDLYRRITRFNQSSAWLNLGNIAKQDKDYATAESCYKSGLAVSAFQSGGYPTVPPLKLEYAALLEKQGREPATVKRLREEAQSAGEGILEGL